MRTSCAPFSISYFFPSSLINYLSHASCYHFILAKMSPTGGVTFEAARVLRGMPNYVDSTVYEDFCIVAVPYGDATGAAGTDDSNPKYFGLMMINWRTGKQLTIESGITIDAQNDEAVRHPSFSTQCIILKVFLISISGNSLAWLSHPNTCT
jgi:hypothetical protein